MKIPVIIVVGPKDVEAQTVSLRLKDTEKTIGLVELAKFLENLK